MIDSVQATDNDSGAINPISGRFGDSVSDAYLRIRGTTWLFYTLPEVSESKDANYSDIQILGRSSPVKTYSGSGYRTLSVTFSLPATSQAMLEYNRNFVRAVASLTHPQYDSTYLPPPIAKFKLGDMVSGLEGKGVSVVCMNYSYDMSPETVWVGKTSLIPIHMSLRAEFHVVYPYFRLPGADEVIQGKY